MGRRRTLELKLRLAPQEIARLEELADFEGESLEDTIRLVLQYHWNSYELVLAEFEALKLEASDEPPRPTSPDDDIPW